MTSWSVSSTYICLSLTDLTRIHQCCVNTSEMDLYVWTWKVNTAAPCSVTGISYKADNCGFCWRKQIEDVSELSPDKDADDGEPREHSQYKTKHKIWMGKVHEFTHYHWGWGLTLKAQIPYLLERPWVVILTARFQILLSLMINTQYRE